MELTEYLDYIDPESCNYEEWVEVGMALKAEGYSCSVWDEWSSKDPRYKDGECYSKWESFNSSGVKGGTIANMATERGFTGRKKNTSFSSSDFLSFTTTLNVNDYATYDLSFAKTPKQSATKPMFKEGHRQLIEYLLTLFEPNDYVSYSAQAFCDPNGDYSPTHGNYSFTAGELVTRLEKYQDIDMALGATDKNAGAWIRFNPVDGIIKGNNKGMSDLNVTAYRYALVESDSLPITEQKEIYEKLQLPIAALVYSGGKSLHAIVRIDAKSKSEYAKKVQYLYSACEQHGLIVDEQNKNPSRLSRMPGVPRGDDTQTLVATNTGKESYKEWKEWYLLEQKKERLPEVIDFGQVSLDLPEVAPVVIEGLLREGHKMILTGPSKAGKSFALQSLMIAFAQGSKWFDEFQVRQGKVFYINLEIDPASFYQRILHIYDALEIPESERCYHNIRIWNLRGHSMPLNKLVPLIIDLVKDQGYTAVILDPIYKVITGDENSAKDMGEFCNQFDRIAAETGCSVIYCHHHSKSAVNHRESMNRGSGSTVFSRDPDAILDLTKYEQSQEFLEAYVDYLENVELKKNLKAIAQVNFIDTTQDDWMDVFKEHYPNDYKQIVQHNQEQLKVWKERRDKKAVCWQLDATLREFAWERPLRVWFDFPIHHVDNTPVNIPELPKLATITDDSMIQAHEARKDQSKGKIEEMANTLMVLKEKGLEPTINNILSTINVRGRKKTSYKAMWQKFQRSPLNKRFKVIEGVVYDIEHDEIPEEENDLNESTFTSTNSENSKD